MAFWDDDLDVFFDDFAIDAELLSSGANVLKIGEKFPVIFDETVKEFKSGSSNIVATGPEIKLKESDAVLFGLKKNDTLKIDLKNWMITSPAKTDSPGIKIFKLQEI